MPSKRSHGEGTLRHRSDGRWELRMMDGYQKDGSPRFKTFYGKTQKEVKLKLKEYQDALISGVQLDTILYFEDWADTWFEGHKDNIAPTTQESYKYCLKMLKEGFYHRPLTVIRPIDIENFLKGMRRDGRSDSYISKARGMLYQIFQKAEANDLVRRNPVRLAEKMRATGTAKRKEAFTTAEVAHLMKVLPDDRMGLSIRLLLGTGMRMQELLALEPQFIEEDGSVIHIRQAVKVVKGTVSIGSPKSKDSIRDIPVPLNVRPCAIKLRDTTDQFIWESPKTGLPCNPTHFRDVFRKSLEEAGDVRLLTPHSCRHTYVSQMQALGVDIQTIRSSYKKMALTNISINAFRCFFCEISNFLNFISQNRMKSSLKLGFFNFSSAIFAVSSSFWISKASRRSFVVRVYKPSSIAFIRLSSFLLTSRSCFSSSGIVVFS